MSASQCAWRARQFAEFHTAHPEVYSMFFQLTFDRIRRGFQHYSARAVLHRIRWETALPLPDDDPSGFKINNNYSAFYARMFHRDCPLYDGFFRLRTSVADGVFDRPDDEPDDEPDDDLDEAA